MKTLKSLWNDEAGFIVSTELVLIATILVLGMIVGLTTLRNDVVAELADVASAIGAISQDYDYSGVSGHSSNTAGSSFIDNADFCDLDGSVDPTGSASQCVNVNVPANAE